MNEYVRRHTINNLKLNDFARDPDDDTTRFDTVFSVITGRSGYDFCIYRGVMFRLSAETEMMTRKQARDYVLDQLFERGEVR